MEIPVCGEIKSRADFRRVLAEVIRFTFGEIGDGHFVDSRWLRINKELVVHCYKEADAMIRIISARKATKRERGFYEERI
jgi:hypothetical protein